MQLRTTAPTHRTPIAPLPAGQRLCDAPVDAALIRAEIFVSERNEDDSDERQCEGEVRGYVPLSKDDTGILDLGVPTGMGGLYIDTDASSSYIPQHLHRTGWTHVHIAISVSTVSVIHCCWY